MFTSNLSPLYLFVFVLFLIFIFRDKLLVSPPLPSALLPAAVRCSAPRCCALLCSPLLCVALLPAAVRCSALPYGCQLLGTADGQQVCQRSLLFPLTSALRYCILLALLRFSLQEDVDGEERVNRVDVK